MEFRGFVRRLRHTAVFHYRLRESTMSSLKQSRGSVDTSIIRIMSRASVP